MKKIVTMQDISCVGKCSLTVALPVISAMGIETAVLPTAVLSTHTMFHGFTFHDLTNEIQPIMDHWKKEGFTFDAVYTGYLGSFEQLELAARLFDEFGTGLRVVDPCMADEGKLYPGFTRDFAASMAKLCSKADVIVPNLTEASLLLDIPYVSVYDETYIQNILRKLTDLGDETAVLTGVTLSEGKLGAYAYNRKENRYYHYYTAEEKEHFHGTGDLWASAFTGALVLGKTFEQALKIACDFVQESIHKTLAEPDHNEYGVNFEQAIPSLIQSIQ